MKFKIPAIIQISLSEIQKVKPEVTKEWIESNQGEFMQMLHSLGADVTYKVTEEYNQHRNRFEEVVTTYRWVCEERRDDSWLTSGYASEAAIDRGLDNQLLNDCYRLRGIVAE